jgi:nitronate monooxygenase
MVVGADPAWTVRHGGTVALPGAAGAKRAAYDRPVFALDDLAVPIVLAPMAGGPSTPALAAAVSEAGGLGFLGAGYKSAAAMAQEVEATRALTQAPFGVNLFELRGAAPGPPEAVAAYAATLPEPVGEPRVDDDEIDAKLAALLADPVAVGSFTFGCPERATIDALHACGTAVWVTVTTREEAREAQAAGADAVVAQGAEAGGHRGSFTDRDDEPLALLALLQVLDTDLPIVATGGIANARGVAAVLAAGAQAAQAGTAFMLCPEAGTHPAHRERIGTDAPTGLTRAFTGRRARGIVNGFQAAHPDAPSAYPEIHHLTAPYRAAARERGDADGFNLWAGQAHALAEARPAAEVVAALTPRERYRQANTGCS